MPTKVAKYNLTIATLNAGGVTPFTGFAYDTSASNYAYKISKHGENYLTLATYRGVGNTPFTGFYQNTTSGFIPTGAVLGISYAGITVSTYRNTGKTPFAGFFKGFTTHPITSRHFIYATSITITGDTSASKYREAPRTAFIDVFGNAIGDSARDIQRNNPASQNAINVDAQSVQVDRTAYIAGADFATAQENKEMSQVARATGYLATKAIQSRDLFRRSAVREQLRSTSGRTSILGRVASVAETVSTTIQKTLTFFGTSATSTTTTAQSWKNLSAVAYGRFYGVVSVVGESQQQFFRNSSDPLSETIRGLRFQADSKTGAKTEQLLSSGTTSSEKDRLSAVNETLSSEGAQSKSLFRSTFVAGHLFESNASKAIYNRVSKTVEAFISTTQKTLTFEGNSSVVIASESSSIRRFAIDALTQAYALSFSVATSAQQFVLNSAESIQSNATESRTLQYQRNNSIAETFYSATASKADRYKDSATSASSTVVASQRKTVFLSSRLLQSVFSTSKEFRVLARISSISESMVVAVQKSLAFDGSSSSVIGSESTSIRRFAGNAFTTSFSVSYSVAVSAEQFIASATQQLFESVTDQKVGSVSRVSASSGTIKSTSAENRDLFKNSFASEQSFAVSPQRRTASLSSYVSESLISNAKFNVIVDRASATSESLFSTIEKTALFVGDSSVSTTLVSSVWRNLSASPFGLASSFSSIVATTTQQFVLSSAEVLSETARSIRLYEAKRTSAIAETVSSSASTVFGFLRNSSATESPRSAGISAVRNVASSSVREVLRNTTASYRDLTGVSSTDIRLFVVSASNTTKTFTSSVLDLYSVSSTQSIDSFRASAVETISSATNDSRRSLSSAGLVGLATATSYVRGISSVGILASSATFATLSSSAYRIIGYERYSSVANSMSLAKHYLVRGVTRANLGITLATYSGSGNTPFTGFGFRPHLPMFEDRSLLEGIVEVTKYVSNATSELLESSIEKNGTLARISASTEIFTSRTEKSTTNYEVGYSSGRIISSSWRAFTANAFNGSTLLSYVIGNSSNNFFNSSSNAITEVIRGEKYQTSNSTSSVSEASSVVAEEQRELSRSSASSENSFASGVKNIGMYRVSTATETLFTTLSSSANFSRFGTIAESLKSAIEKSALFVTNSTASIRSESSSSRQFAGVSFAGAYALSLAVATSARNAVVSSTNTISQTILGARLYSAFRDSTATETLSSVGAQNKDMYRDASVLENEFANALQSKDISRSAITATSMDATSEKTSVLDRVSKVTERFVSSAQKNALFVGNSSVLNVSQSSSNRTFFASAFSGAYSLSVAIGISTRNALVSNADTIRQAVRDSRSYSASRNNSTSETIFSSAEQNKEMFRDSSVLENLVSSAPQSRDVSRSTATALSMFATSQRKSVFERISRVSEILVSSVEKSALFVGSASVSTTPQSSSGKNYLASAFAGAYALLFSVGTKTEEFALSSASTVRETARTGRLYEADRSGSVSGAIFAVGNDAVVRVRNAISTGLESALGVISAGRSGVSEVTESQFLSGISAGEKTRSSSVNESLSSNSVRIFGFTRFGQVTETILSRGTSTAERILSSQVVELSENASTQYRNIFGTSANYSLNVVRLTSTISKNLANYVLGAVTSSNTKSVESDRTGYAINTFFTAVASVRSYRLTSFVGYVIGTSSVNGVTAKSIFAPSVVTGTLSSSAYRIIGYERYSSVAESMSLARHILVRGVTRANLGITLATYSGGGNTPFTGFGFRPAFPIFQDKSLLEGIITVTRFVANRTTLVSDSSVFTSGGFLGTSAVAETENAVATTTAERVTTSAGVEVQETRAGRFLVRVRSSSVIGSSSEQGTISAGRFAVAFISESFRVIATSARDVSKTAFASQLSVIRATQNATRNLSSSVKEFFAVRNENYTTFVGESAVFEILVGRAVKSFGSLRTSSVSENQFTTETQSRDLSVSSASYESLLSRVQKELVFSRESSVSENLATALDKTALFIATSNINILSVSSSWREFAGNAFGKTYSLSYAIATSARQAIRSASDTINESITEVRLYNASRSSAVESLVFASAVESRDVTKSSSTELLVTSSNTRSTTFSGVSYILQTMVSTSQEFREIIRDSSVVEFVMSVTASKETSSYPVVGFSFVGRTIQSFTTVAGAIRTITRDATVVEVPIAREEKTTTKLRNNFTTQSLSTVTTQARSFFRDSSLLELFSTSTSQKSLIIGVQGVTDIYAVRVIQAFATVATTIRNIAKTSAVEENNIVADQRTTTVVRSSEVSENLASSGASSIAFIGLSADVGLFVVNAVKSVGNVASSSVSEFFTTATNSARTLVTNSSPLIASIARNANYRISALSSAVFGFGSSMDIKSYEALRTGYVAERMSSSAQGRRDLYGNTTIALASFVIAVRDVVFVASSPLVQNAYSVASRQQNVIKDGSTVTLYESAHANAYRGFAVLAFSKGLQTVLTLGSAVNSFQTFGRNSRITETPKTTDERTTSMVKSASISESMAEANYKKGSFFRYSIVLQELSSIKKIVQSSLPIRIANRAITIATYAGLGDVPFLGFTTPRSEVTAYLLPAVASVERVRSNRTVELFRSISESTRTIVSSSSVSENESVVATQYATRNLSGFVSENLSTVASQARSFFRDSSLAELLSASTSYKSLLIGVSSAIDNVTGRTIQAFTSVATSFRTSSENSAVSLSEETRGVSTRASIVVSAISEIYSSTAGKVFESVRLPSFATYFTTTSARTTTWFGTSANALTEVVIATIQRSQSASGYANAVAQTFYSTSQEFRVFFRDGTTRELISSSTSYKSLVLGVIAVMDGAVGRTIQTLLSTSASLRVLSRVSKVEENQSVSEKKTTTLFSSNTTTENLSSVASQNRSFFRDSSLIELLSTTTSYKSLVIAVTSIGDVFVGRTIQTMASVAGVFRTIDRSNATSENEATTTANFTTRTKEGSTTENLSSVASQNRSFLRDSSLIELISTSTSYKSLIIAVTSVGDVFVGRVIQLLATAGTITQTSFRNSNATENQHVVAGEFSTRVKNGEATETLTSTSSRSTGKTLISAVKESFASATEKSALFNAVARAELYEMPEAKKYREIVRSATVNEIMSSSVYRFIGQDKFGSASSSEFVTDGRTKSSNVSSASALDEQPTSFKEVVFFGAAAVIATILSTSAFFRNIIKVSSVEQFSSSSGQKSISIRKQQSSISTTQAVTSGKYVQHTRESAQALRATVRSARRTFRTRVGESIFNEFATSSIFFLQIIHTIKTIFEEDALGFYEDSTIVYREKMEGTVFTEDANFFGEDGVTFYEE